MRRISMMTLQERANELNRTNKYLGAQKKRAIPAVIKRSSSDNCLLSCLIVRREEDVQADIMCLVISDKKFFKELWNNFYMRASGGEIVRLFGILPTEKRETRTDWEFFFKGETNSFKINKNLASLRKVVKA